jgi:hypothetical protein
MAMKRLASIVIILLLSSVGFGADIYVNHTGSGTPPYDTEAKATTDIQVALDAAGSGDTILIKADQDYVMDGTDQQTAQFDIDTSSNITIRGYFSTVGDQEYGGTYYKHSSNGWVVIDADNGAFHVFSVGDKNKLRWHNLKTTNVSTSYTAYDLTPITEQEGYLLQNCVITGGKHAVNATYLSNLIIQDCTLTGAYTTIPVLGAIYFGNTCLRGVIIQDCNFSHGNTAKSIYCMNVGMNVIERNIFNITGTVGAVIQIGRAGLLANNVIYEGSGGNITDGIKIETNGQSTAIYNNIIVGCTKSINDLATVNFGGWNCFYNNGSNWVLRDGDIAADPQFMDAVNGNFKLKPTSPCLNAGKPTMLSGYTSIGVWQRISRIRR